ncbi:MAG: sigma-70 family RNA polymerase sigma factor [Lachnospiraceae bacterium]|nr:sigma-70 family RNA polymerase sigma factor [Lachnospiraceae bacterium]
MEDKQIIELFWARAEQAITATDEKYGKYCYYIAYNILHSNEDSEECVNDTYLKAWESIPPHRPERLAAFLGKITRNLSINKYKYLTAGKRGEGQYEMALEELNECIPSAVSVEQIMEDRELSEVFNRFLEMLPVEKRKVFMRRYWYFSPVKEIAAEYGMSESKVKMSLLRTRSAFRQYLEKEGVAL